MEGLGKSLGLSTTGHDSEARGLFHCIEGGEDVSRGRSTFKQSGGRRGASAREKRRLECTINYDRVGGNSAGLEKQSKQLLQDKVSAGIMFTRGVLSCLKYLEAVPWDENEEEKLKRLFTRFTFDDATTRDILARLYSLDSVDSQQHLAIQLVWLITNGTDLNARRELKSLVKDLLSKSSVYEGTADLSKEDLYLVCQSCLSSLECLLEEASDSIPEVRLTREPTVKPLIERISCQVDNLNWLLDILLEQQIAEEFVSIWMDQGELIRMHERASPMVRYELSRISAFVFIALGTGKLHCRSEVRSGVLQAWFEPMLSDFGWLQRCRKGLNIKELEEAMGQLLLTLPLKQQYLLFMEWFRCYSKNGFCVVDEPITEEKSMVQCSTVELDESDRAICSALWFVVLHLAIHLNNLFAIHLNIIFCAPAEKEKISGVSRGNQVNEDILGQHHSIWTVRELGII
ncbi:hypothetical protein HHK36_004252 [Tetracentron sinense]|uniref:At3g05675-like ankyrin-like domain-containing protein n=1 Tax=Tetracentron sinense TaxID=13715 RepID=A0A835DT07_TETSI|nr:hypothetical protein HHK36_004252 [Tetracentron sinense]